MKREGEVYTCVVEFPVHPVSLPESAKAGVIVVDQLIKVVYSRERG